VGTTTLRALEAAAAGGGLKAGEGETDLFVRPGFRFRVVDRLLTNFHLPRSTLMVLVAAFAGLGSIRRAYDHAIARVTGSSATATRCCWKRPLRSANEGCGRRRSATKPPVSRRFRHFCGKLSRWRTSGAWQRALVFATVHATETRRRPGAGELDSSPDQAVARH
jgi:hypothetical protein